MAKKKPKPDPVPETMGPVVKTATPGPWHWAAPGDLRNEDGVEVGGCLDRLDLTDHEHEADASLIAAAPDLLSACQALVAYSETSINCAVCANGGDAHDADCPVPAAREAIAKATGT
jgi:hypothetical protein